jgi:hypothetical protein
MFLLSTGCHLTQLFPVLYLFTQTGSQDPFKDPLIPSEACQPEGPKSRAEKQVRTSSQLSGIMHFWQPLGVFSKIITAMSLRGL